MLQKILSLFLFLTLLQVAGCASYSGKTRLPATTTDEISYFLSIDKFNPTAKSNLSSGLHFAMDEILGFLFFAF